MESRLPSELIQNALTEGESFSENSMRSIQAPFDIMGESQGLLESDADDQNAVFYEAVARLKPTFPHLSNLDPSSQLEDEATDAAGIVPRPLRILQQGRGVLTITLEGWSPLYGWESRNVKRGKKLEQIENQMQGQTEFDSKTELENDKAQHKVKQDISNEKPQVNRCHGFCRLFSWIPASSRCCSHEQNQSDSFKNFFDQEKRKKYLVSHSSSVLHAFLGAMTIIILIFGIVLLQMVLSNSTSDGMHRVGASLLSELNAQIASHVALLAYLPVESSQIMALAVSKKLFGGETTFSLDSRRLNMKNVQFHSELDSSLTGQLLRSVEGRTLNRVFVADIKSNQYLEASWVYEDLTAKDLHRTLKIRVLDSSLTLSQAISQGIAGNILEYDVKNGLRVESSVRRLNKWFEMEKQSWFVSIFF